MMSTSPISKLDNDALLAIFDSLTCRIPNTDTQTQDRPLTLVRAASQVCQEWRRLSLASPWIWGRVVDLDINERPGPRRIEWMDEVVKRAGLAPLWISGFVMEPVKGSNLFDTQSYFIRLMAAWERIERLSVVIYGRKIPDDIQNYFLSRAPILKSFDVSLPDIRESLFLNTLQSDSSQSLFADHAPSLREINAESVAFKSNSPWLSHIREIYRIPRNLGLKNLFSILQHTPSLERIRINQNDQPWDPTWPSFPKASLPNLSYIELWTTLTVAAGILNNLSPARFSVLRMNIMEPGTSALNNGYILSSFKENLPFYISNYFTLNPSTDLLIMFMRRGFRLQDATKRGVDDGDQNFNIMISTPSSDQSSHDIVSCLLDVFTLTSTPSTISSLFKSVTELRLSLIDPQPTMIPKIYSMLAVFQQVQYIQTNERSGQTLWAISCLDEAGGDQQHVVFPELHTLRLTSRDSDDGKTYTGLTLFLMKRKEIGCPVARLDLTTCKRSYYAQDLRALEEVNGLEVVWVKPGHESGKDCGISTYICGTGRPEQLKGIL